MANNESKDTKKGGSFDGIVVDDGSVKEVIRNQFGDELGVFYFRPTDIGIIERFNKVAATFGDIIAPLENLTISSDGSVEGDEHDQAVMDEAKNKLYEACDYIFGGNMSEAFFGKMNPFSPVNASFYCEIALSAVGNYISKQFAEQTKKIEARINKYTHGQAARTGKHKDGKK